MLCVNVAKIMSAQIISFGTGCSRCNPRCRKVLKTPYDSRFCCKACSYGACTTIDKRCETESDPRSRCNKNPQIKKLLDVAMSID